MDTDHLTPCRIAKQFNGKEATWLLLRAQRWLDGPVCPHCATVDDAYYLTPRVAQARLARATPRSAAYRNALCVGQQMALPPLYASMGVVPADVGRFLSRRDSLLGLH
jgi:hypothetical protein